MQIAADNARKMDMSKMQMTWGKKRRGFLHTCSLKLPHTSKICSVSSCDSHCGKASGYFPEYTPWAFFMIDVISEHGVVPGVFDVGQSFGLLIDRFECYWKPFLRPPLVKLEDEYNSAKHCTCFGLSKMSAIALHSKLRNPKQCGQFWLRPFIVIKNLLVSDFFDPTGSLFGILLLFEIL